MKSVKVIFIAMEIAVLIGVIMIVFITDWVEAKVRGVDYLFRIIIVLCSLLAVVFQREQQAIDWDENEE